jgi:hypothetical protein
MQVAELLASPSLDALLADDPETEERLVEDARRLAARAYPADRVTDRSTDAWVDHGARDELHRALLACYQPHVRLPHHGMAVNQFHPLAVRLLAALERPWERDLLARARRSAHRLGTELALDDLPADPDAFCDWYKTTAFTHPLYEHPLYGFLAGEADRAQMERFLRWEAAGEAAFDDLVALGQVGTRGEVKIEMGRNYWDELGNGKSHAVHTHLFHKLTETLAITAPEADELPWQILGGVNVMLWSCIPRRNAFRAQGTLGAVELLAPQRCTRTRHRRAPPRHPQEGDGVLRRARDHRRRPCRGVARPRRQAAGGRAPRGAARHRRGAAGARGCVAGLLRLLDGGAQALSG